MMKSGKLNMDNLSNITIFEDISQKVHEWSLWTLGLFFFLCLVSLTTIIGNGVVLYVFAKSKRALRLPCHILLANLAVADLLVGLLVMPVLTTMTVFDYKWYWGDLMCQLGDYIHFVLCATSILSMVAICLERYVGIRYPMHHKRILSKKRVRGISGAIWLVALVLTATPLSVWPITGNRIPLTCLVNLRPDFIFFVSVSLYWIPIMIICYIYWLIYKTSKIPSTELMKWAKKSLASTAASTASSSSRRGSKSDEEKFEKARSKQTRILKKMTKMILTMLLFYGPLFFLFLLKGFRVSWVSIDLLLAFGWLRYMSSCTNTFLYIYVVPYYKRQLLKLLCNASSSQNDKSESKSGVNPEDKRSSYSYSSSCEESTGRTLVNFEPSKSPNLTHDYTKGKLEDNLSRLTNKSITNPEENSGLNENTNGKGMRWTIIKEMDDIVSNINTEIMGTLVKQVD